MDLQTHNLDELKQQMLPLCVSKAEEFHLLGYEHVTAVEIWDCVSSGYRKEIPAIHKMVNDILSLKVTTFMNWMTMKIYQGGLD